MSTEYEVRFLDINEQEIIKKLEKADATFVGDWIQIRNVYDLIPHKHNNWVRLRTNGKETTLAVKEIKSDTIDGTQEFEITVSDFDMTVKILEKLGYFPRGRQENRRKRYILNNVEIDIDTWPTIPTYLEIEGNDENEVKEICRLLDLDYSKACTMGILDIALKIYKIPKNEIDNVSFPKN